MTVIDLLMLRFVNACSVLKVSSCGCYEMPVPWSSLKTKKYPRTGSQERWESVQVVWIYGEGELN